MGTIMDDLLVAQVENLRAKLMREHDFDIAPDLEALLPELRADLNAYMANDPANENDPELIVQAHGGFLAQLSYRVARQLILRGGSCYRLASHVLRHWACGKFGVDIHPGARLEEGIVLDHSYGIVVGETAEIGRGSYVLGGAVIGARTICGNPTGKRHPTIGRNCQIGYRARILGPVVLGDRVFVAPYAVVTESLPDDTSVVVLSENMKIRRRETCSPSLPA
jgi:serine O-acetyltransferase